MTRHTYRPGGAIDPGAVYYPMDGARQRDPLEPDDVIAALDAWVEREEPEEQAEFAGYWIGPFEWRGGGERPGPLPPGVEIKPSCYSSTKQSHEMIWALRFRFRYRADNPAGWLPRGDWIPPAELWDEGCPVRCEWKADTGRDVIDGDNWLEGWGSVTHIRLVASQPQAGLPEGFGISAEGSLYARRGIIFTKAELEKYGPAAIRQAVDAWLREMGDEG